VQIDWMVVATITAPIIAGILVVYVSRAVEARPRLITWLVHASTVTVGRRQPAQAQGQATPVQQIPVNSHSIVVRNAGRRPAHNVSIIHTILPDYSVYPPIWYEQRDLPSGGGEIVFPTLAPNEQVTVTYIYSTTTIWSQVNLITRSDEGQARAINVTPSIQYPRWSLIAFAVVFWIGVISIAYLLWQFGLWISTIRHT
jgi:hypothetical protein